MSARDLSPEPSPSPAAPGATSAQKGTFTISGTPIVIAGFDHAKCSDNVTFNAIFTAKGTITLPGL